MSNAGRTEAIVLFVVLCCCVRCSGEETRYEPTAPVVHEWIEHVLAVSVRDGLDIVISYARPSKTSRNAVYYEDLAVSVVDDHATRAIPIEGKGHVAGVHLSARQSQARVTLKTDAGNIRMVLVRIRDLVVALAPVVNRGDAGADEPK